MIKNYDKLVNFFDKIKLHNGKCYINEKEIENTNEEHFENIFEINEIILSCISDKIDKKNLFLQEYQTITGEFIDYTISEHIKWRIDLYQKFVWIALMISLKLVPSASKYIIEELVKDNHDIIFKEDTNGINCLMVACTNSSIEELLRHYPTSYLRTSSSNGITGYDVLTYFNNIENKIKIDDYITYVNPTNKITPYHLISITDNVNLLKYILSQNNPEFVSKQDIYENNPLDVACIYSSLKIINFLLSQKFFINITKKMEPYLEKFEIFKLFLNYNLINERIISFNLNLFQKENFFEEFIKSKVFTYELLTTTHPSLYDLLFVKNENYFC
jgi:ankyrin repeat protein